MRYILLFLIMGFALHDVKSQQASKSYTFPVRPGSPTWNNFKSHDEMTSACQLPDDILKNSSTRDLISIYLDYPLLLDIAAFNSLQDGFEQAQINFNGLSELLSRTDLPNTAIEYYRTMSIDTVKKFTTPLQQGLYSYKIWALEILLSQESVISSLSTDKDPIWLRITSSKLSEKRNISEVYGGNGVISTLLLSARLLQKSRYAPFIEEIGKNKMLAQFIKKATLIDSNGAKLIENATQSYLRRH